TYVGKGSLQPRYSDETIEIPKLYFCPKLATKLVSLGVLTSLGYVVTFEKNEMHVFKGGNQVATMSKHLDQLYYLVEKLPGDAIRKKVLAIAPTKDIMVAHEEYGHLSEGPLRATLRDENIRVTGEWKQCDACARAKARQKAVPKTTEAKATRPGERICIDTSGPFQETPAGSRYWIKCVDEYTRKSFDGFVRSKSQLSARAGEWIIRFNGEGKKVTYLRCDNAGEHQTKLKQVCDKLGVTLEYTAPNTPQQNGIVERRFATDHNRANAMLIASRLTHEVQQRLWAEAAYTAARIGNAVRNSVNEKCPDEMWSETPPAIFPHLKEFGRLAYVTIRQKIKRKFTEKAIKCVFVGYEPNHAGDVYRLYNPATDHVIVSRDVKWG
ncbi:MAG: hypothetical protein ACRDL7_11350, partial [Gaiellaceae bacterium]